MFAVPKRIKDALDRTLAEEQARHKAFNDRRAASANDAAGTFAAADSGQPAQAGSTNPDPSVFELEDDTDPSSRSSTPKHAASGADGADSGKDSATKGQNNGADKAAAAGASNKTMPAPSEPAVHQNLPPDVELKLKKYDKLQATYRELLRSYRIAHSRIEPFERALRENTPLSSIKDPAAFIEYLGQKKEQSDLTTKELNLVSVEKDKWKKKSDESDKEIAILKDRVSALETAQADKNGAKPDEEKGAEGEDMFSYDDEIPKLQAELGSKDEQITRLTSEVDTLKEALAVAKETHKVSGSADNVTDTRDSESDSPKDTIERLEKKFREIQADVEKQKAAHASALVKKNSEIEKLEGLTKEYTTERNRISDDLSQMSKAMALLRDENETYKSENTSCKAKIEELESTLKAAETTKGLGTVSSTTPGAPTPTGSSKKNKKKKGGASRPVVGIMPSQVPDTPLPSPSEASITEALQTEISKLKDEVAEKDSQIDKLSRRRKTEEDLQEEVETLRESVAANGQDLVEAKQKLKEDENEKTAHKSRISELEKELAANSSSKTQLEAKVDSMTKDLEESSAKAKTMQSELRAAQQLAQDRFKDNATLKAIIAETQSRAKTLEKDSAALKTTQEDLASKQKEIRALEKRERELKNEVGRLKRQCSDYESEIKSLKQQVSTGKGQITKLEDEKRKLGRDNRRLEAENTDITSNLKKGDEQLSAARSELSSLQPKVKRLEEEVAQLQKEKKFLKEEADLKTKQYDNVNKLLAIMRDEASELVTQRKESDRQVESLGEELADAQRHLSERTREAETMRRMLADANERTDARIRDMRSQMEAATEERDQFEGKYSALARQRSREAEESRNMLHELENEAKRLGLERDNLEARERAAHQRCQKLEQDLENATAQSQVKEAIISNLRLNQAASDQEARDAKKEKDDSKKRLEEVRGRYERANKELQSARRQVNGDDIAYLKNIFLQFLEFKDDKMRSQLIPVFGRLLKFDQQEEQRALQHLHLLRPNR